MHILLFDTPARTKLFPLTLTRAIADLRFGMFTIKERWEKFTSVRVAVLTAPYLQNLYEQTAAGEYILIDASVIPTKQLIEQIRGLQINEGLEDNNGVIAARLNFDKPPTFDFDMSSLVQNKITIEDVRRLEYPSQIYQWNAEIIGDDFDHSTLGLHSLNNYDTAQFINSARIFIEEGAKLSFCILNASEGPIYIGKNTTVMEGCLIRGPFVLCDGATLKMGTKIYGGTTIGPCSVAGGEIKNSVITGFSNKAHDGYLGDSVIGEWCNLGAGTSNSNVKNTGSEVKVWNFFHEGYINAGIKAGFIMGDYSRTSINTSINTGTVVGICCNVFGEGLTPKVISNFTWGTKELTRYEFDKALKDIMNWMKMKSKDFTPEQENVLKYVFDNYND
ncbi:MAG TPA: putative sugar nucleotidyl transferase [Segetibacter sp.]|jgi:UDP-N-acetylglucosamine diphosphorylase/glucosamine-1-phosphate N-acetyltransferase